MDDVICCNCGTVVHPYKIDNGKCPWCPDKNSIRMKTVAEIIKESKTSSFQYYREGNFYYKTDAGYEFVIPLDDISGATLNAEEKTIFFMRWIRKQLAEKQSTGV